ncbi:endonuclease/exonuclease/phosphatase family protein [Pelagibacterium halotolerans]|uniref:Endonuclease/exonuclease/phosphatase domain-containing protein n=1 Tax=Pelagibacterium halotolerans (strain DSM 22347 / JCM 15775 / CGMCC 1.7692 / B2) TaxID=1082931 RepID=G4REV9_PELHB|nr:endonuclease/exonuclease/phosphatase family protein [Pelagibacterium halotolerans]AEQ51930.1 hypothetical protein KKY_1920 [Pelagibacterium halotolerans B2]QJR18275.1 hypothetical protein HKM20_07415 [Pelagibacterium halotolerans]SEA27299.1 Uncharacterized conserved protein YafD, endonuclease/exonuclease/phosphatase (EEP) superfamily [Pelagibacterium halotolerans]
MAIGAEIRGVLTGFGLVAAGVLVLARVDLGLPGQSLLQSLQLHIGAGLLGLALLLALARAPWRAGLVAAMAIFAGGHVMWRVAAQYEGRGALQELERAAGFTLLSFNVLNSNDRHEDVTDYIAGSGADFAFIMEAAQLRQHLDDLHAVYPYRVGCEPSVECDLMMLSKLPLENAEIRSLGNTHPNRMIVAQAEIEGEPLTLVAAHLTKPYFDDAGLFEARRLARQLAGIEGALVLAGDFNSAPWADAIDDLVRGSDLLPPPRYNATWPTELGPLGIPIDLMFSRAPILIEEIEALSDPLGSNHLGLIARLGIAAE